MYKRSILWLVFRGWGRQTIHFWTCDFFIMRIYPVYGFRIFTNFHVVYGNRTSQAIVFFFRFLRCPCENVRLCTTKHVSPLNVIVV